MQATSSQVTPSASHPFPNGFITARLSVQPTPAVILPLQATVAQPEERPQTLEGRRRRGNRRRAR
ncbi:MAG: hypothetical protein AAFO74_02145 [Pseudomonadota bacterium]